MTYTQLVTAIQQYCEVYEATFVASIPTFVRNAEKRIFHEAALPHQIKRVGFGLVAGDGSIVVPDDLLSVEGVSVDGGDTLEWAEPEFASSAFPSEGVPKVWTRLDQGFIVVYPSPNDSFLVMLRYRAYPESIVTASTTWIGDNFDQVLLYGALVEAYVFLKGEADVLQAVNGVYEASLRGLKEHLARANKDQQGR